MVTSPPNHSFVCQSSRAIGQAHLPHFTDLKQTNKKHPDSAGVVSHPSDKPSRGQDSGLSLHPALGLNWTLPATGPHSGYPGVLISFAFMQSNS